MKKLTFDMMNVGMNTKNIVDNVGSFDQQCYYEQ